MGRVTGKYMGVGDGDGEGKTRPHPRPIVVPIWKERNKRAFHQQVADFYSLADSDKLLSFQWPKANMSTFVYSYYDWWNHPLYCMGVMM